MSKIFKKFVEKILALLVRIKLKRIKPCVIGVTGSLGKTSTKEAIYCVLSSKWRTYRNAKSLNTEIGLLLAILEQKSGFSSPLQWMKIIIGAVWNAIFGKKYDFLVLEYGADKPGDIEHLISVVKPDISIITRIARVHQADLQFADIRAVFEEKKKLVTCLDKEGIAILNFVDPYLQSLGNQLNAKTFFWSGSAAHDKVAIYADKLVSTKMGFDATVHYGKDKISASFPIAGVYHIDVILPALLCGELLGVSIRDGIRALQTFRLPPGRMSIIEGKNGSTLLDSSYNASPEAVKQALQLLHSFPGKRKIAVLGNMNELGDYAQEEHRAIASSIGLWLDTLITVGENAKLIADQALKIGMPKARIKSFMSAEEAGKWLLVNGAGHGDIILFKGSQNKVRLERSVKMLMANERDAKELLCRQEREWEGIE